MCAHLHEQQRGSWFHCHQGWWLGRRRFSQGWSGWWQQLRKRKGETGVESFQKKSYRMVGDPWKSQGVVLEWLSCWKTGGGELNSQKLGGQGFPWQFYVKTLLPMQGAQVQSQVGELRYHVPPGATKHLKKKKGVGRIEKNRAWIW